MYVLQQTLSFSHNEWMTVPTENVEEHFPIWQGLF